MRVLITGGGGFLGAAIARALVARGDTAIAFDTQLAGLANAARTSAWSACPATSPTWPTSRTR